MATLVPVSGKSTLPSSTSSSSTLLGFWAGRRRTSTFAAWTSHLVLPLALLTRGLQKSATARKCRRTGQPGYGTSPRTLYDFLGVDHRADTHTIRKAYLAKQKVVHPDVAGVEAQEMSMLLNSAFDVLRDPEKRSVYDASLNNDNQEHFEEHEDTGPTWAWMPKDTRKPAYQGRPRSRSLWDRVPEKNRGEKWEQQRFLFVDELRCILCWNCIECAPKSFCMDADHLRARVYAQWGNCEDDLTWAVKSCPVDCISWVSREELQVLEHVTADHFHTYSPAIRRFRASELPHLAEKFVEKRRHKAELAKQRRELASKHLSVTNEQFHEQLRNAMKKLPPNLRAAGGWS